MTNDTTGRRFATAEIIAVGSELLGATKTETNSLIITARLNELGIQVRVKSVVGDDRQELKDIFVQALGRADLVVLSGGLGPTEDDLTREAVAEALNRPLVEDTAVVDAIRRRFARRNLRMPEVNRRQALVPDGATVVPNPNGTAPGLWIEERGRGVLLLPGPPRELTPMMDRFAREVLGLRVGDERLHRRVIKVTGRTESHVEELTRRVYTRWTEGAPPVWTTILSTPGQIELHLSVRTADEATARDRLAACEDEIAAVLGPYIFSTDGRELEQVVGDLLRERGLTVAVAESCTGGLLMSRLTDVPGSSAYLLAGVVAYGNRSKVELVGVPESLIAEHGAVSEPVARAMAAGARARGCAEIGVGVTGIAGPSGATVGKPVGTVCLAVVGPEGSGVARTLLFPGGRSVVKFQAAQAALDQLRRTILGTDRS